MFEVIHTTTKTGVKMVIYPFNGKVKFCPEKNYNAFCVNYFDPSFDGTPDQCREYINNQE